MALHDARVGDFPLLMPVTAIEAIGAGAGSIAWMDGPVLKVGPRSADARPGPACYGHGGMQPTVSDAYLLCGYLSADPPLEGKLCACGGTSPSRQWRRWRPRASSRGDPVGTGR